MKQENTICFKSKSANIWVWPPLSENIQVFVLQSIISYARISVLFLLTCEYIIIVELIDKSLVVNLWHICQQWHVNYVCLACSTCLSLPFWTAVSVGLVQLCRHPKRRQMSREAFLFSLMPNCSATQYSFVRRATDRCRGNRKEPKNNKSLGRVKGNAGLKEYKGELDMRGGGRKGKALRVNAPKCLPLAICRLAAVEAHFKPSQI